MLNKYSSLRNVIFTLINVISYEVLIFISSKTVQTLERLEYRKILQCLKHHVNL